MPGEARKWYIDEALHSFSRLMAVLNRMNEREVLEALKLESESRRRPSITRRLIGRAARLNELQYVTNLKEQFIHGKEKCGADARG